MIGKQINLGSPKQLQVVLFDELEMPKTKRTKTGYTTDADALQSLFDKTGHPFLQHLLAHRDATRLKVTVDGLLNSVGLRRPDPHHVQPDDRGDRPAVVDRAEPAEHPDPHRRGPPDPRRVRRRRGLRRADDGRLQPDRDADHGAPVRRTRASSRRSAPARTCTRSSRRGRSPCRSTRSPPSCGAGSRRCPTGWPTG